MQVRIIHITIGAKYVVVAEAGVTAHDTRLHQILDKEQIWLLIADMDSYKKSCPKCWLNAWIVVRDKKTKSVVSACCTECGYKDLIAEDA